MHTNIPIHNSHARTHLTYCLGDDDVVSARWQPRFRTVLLHVFRSPVSVIASLIVIPISVQSSLMLSTHFFFGLPLDHCPLPYPCSSRIGYRLLFIRATCPTYVNLRLCKRCTMSSLTSNSCLMSTLRRRSRLVMPHILLRTDILKTLSFRLCSSFKVHVSALYNTMAWTKVWYSITLVPLVISWAFHILSRFLTMPAARPILRSMSLSHD